MLTPHEKLVETVLHILNSMACSILVLALCGPLEIPGGPPVVRSEITAFNFENHCFKLSVVLDKVSLCFDT